MATDLQTLQIIDISNLDFGTSCPKRIEKLVKQFTEACEGPGFFLLKVGHKDFGQLCIKMLKAARELFELPLKEKHNLVNDYTTQMHHLGKPIKGTGAGLRPMGKDPNFVQDLRESYNISCPIKSRCEEDTQMQRLDYSGNGRNKWPKFDLLGPDWKSVIDEYSKVCLESCQLLNQILALALGLDKNYFNQPGFFDNPTCLLGMNHYQFRTQDASNVIGIKPHLDSGVFTLLITDGSEGLERCVNRKTINEVTSDSERIWAPVKCPKPEEGLMIVNLGIQLDFWTGGRFKAILHRVLNKTQKPRYSIPFFFEPNIDAIIRPILNATDKEKEAKMQAYIKEKFGKDHIIPADLFYERLKPGDYY